MVWLKRTASGFVHICSECGLGYKDPKIALKCEEFCKKNNTSSKEISKHATYRG